MRQGLLGHHDRFLEYANATNQESFDTEELDLLAPENLHEQQVVRARDGSAEGIGVLEQGSIGPYAPAGFLSHFDGATG